MKKLQDVISKVQSPFTDDFIKNLIKIYMNAGGDYYAAYDAINRVNEEELCTNEHINTLEKVICDRGTSIDTYERVKDSSGVFHHIYDKKPVYDLNDYWMILMSDPDAFNEHNKQDVDATHLLYRIYLNVKGKEKLECVMGYIEECQKRGLDYQFKFSRKDGRDDEIVIQSTPEHFLENLSIVQDLTKQRQLGKVPLLVGKYENNIGIAEEYYNRFRSPTQTRISLLSAAHIKYICDHRDVALTMCSDEEKEALDNISSYIEDKIKFYESLKAFEKRTIRFGAKLSKLESFSQNILDSFETNDFGNLQIKKLSGVIHKMYNLQPEKFLDEITSNVRYIGNNVFGISKDMVFSVTTEDNIEALKKKDTVNID